MPSVPRTIATRAAVSVLVLAVPAVAAAPAVAAPAPASESAPGSGGAGRACSPTGSVRGFSDALDKRVVGGVGLAGLSGLAVDRRSGGLVAPLDNRGTDLARLWFFRGLPDVALTRSPLVLRNTRGTPYTGTTGDFEGLAVTRRGEYLVSSEVEPSIRVFGRNGVEKASLPVPARFAVAPKGEAKANATLEGLSLDPAKRRLVAAMEGPLSGDAPATGPADLNRLLTYRRHGDTWRPGPQVAYRTDPGHRIAEVQEYAPGRLLVLEASFSPATGNTARLYAVTGLNRGRDVSKVANLSTTPTSALRKQLVTDMTTCPSLGATAKQPQANPLMDNFEGMSARRVHGHRYRVTLVSDDNGNATQVTRLVDLSVRLP